MTPSRSRTRRVVVPSALLLSLATTVAACAGPDTPPHDHEEAPTGEVSQELVSYDCGTRADTGYSNGKAFSITVVTVDGKPVEMQTANAFLTMAKAAEGAGINLRINSGFRTNSEQQYLYGCYINKNCNNGNEAAPPGYSNHQSGHALDINVGGGALAWLNANGAAHGFKRTVASETWHWEWWGGGNPQVYCGCTPSAEVCDGKDNDCDGVADEDEVCEQARLVEMPVGYAAPSTTDVDGDGRADVCARSSAGVHCWRGKASGDFDVESGVVLQPLSDASGWGDPSNYATLRMGDIDGDGRADLCARGDAGIACWTSEKTPLGTPVTGPGWSDAGSWGNTRYFSTLRLADIDGDGKEDLCARAAKGVVCHRSTGSAFEGEIAGPAWSDAAGFVSAKYYGTLRMGDVNGDGKADVCIRGSAGMFCAPSTGTGFGEAFAGPAWTDANGWGNFLYWSSIQLADVNGDGKADICARHSAALVCHFSTGTGFGPAVEVAALTDASGWNDPGNFLTLRTGDIDGDGASDLCIRADATVACWAWKKDAFVSVPGPGWSDTGGWNVPEHYETLRLGDVDGDGKADLCARAAAGFACVGSKGTSFDDSKMTSILTNAAGWNQRPYFGSIFFASPVCRPQKEICNEQDDDCDGQNDEDDVCAKPSTGGAGGASSSGGSGGSFATGGSTATGGGSAGGETGLAGAGSSTSGAAGNGNGNSAKGGATNGEAGSSGRGRSHGDPQTIPGSDETGSCSLSGGTTNGTHASVFGLGAALAWLLARGSRRGRGRTAVR